MQGEKSKPSGQSSALSLGTFLPFSYTSHHFAGAEGPRTEMGTVGMNLLSSLSGWGSPVKDNL